MKSSATRTRDAVLLLKRPFADVDRLVLAQVLCLGAVLAVFGVFGMEVILNPYLPSSEANDGFGYFTGAKSFYLNRELRGVLLHLNYVSPIGEFYSHGFAYSLINGGIALLAGWHDKLIIAVNLAAVAGTAVFIAARDDAWRWKLALLLAFLTYFLTPTMTFAYMQESVQLLLAVLLGYLLMRIVDLDDERRAWGLIACYLIAVCGAATMRATWAFWAFGLLAVAKTKRDVAVFGLVAIAAVVLGALFKNLFYAPYPYFNPYGEAAAALADFRIVDALRSAFGYLALNLKKLFSNDFYVFGITYIPSIWMMVIIALTGYLAYRSVTFRDRRAIAVALIALAYLAAIFTVYDVLAGSRTAAPVFVLQLVYLVKARRQRVLAAILMIHVAAFPAVVGVTGRIVDFHVKAGRHAVAERERLDAVRELGRAASLGRSVTIYLDDAFTNRKFPLTIHLPLRSWDGHLIRYSQDMLATAPISRRVFDPGFIDFVLAGTPISRPDLALVYQRHDLHLYRLR